MLEAVGQDEVQALALLGDLGAEGEVREYAAILRTVGRANLPAFYIPGPGDAPFGKYLREAVIAKTTLGNGAVWDIAFSPDPQQRFLYVADGQNQRVVILQRDSLQEVGSFGAGGRWPGHFYGVGSIGVDSRGHVYTGENLEGKRVQKFVPRPATATPRGTR